MLSDLWSLYALMKKSRLFEEAVARLWRDGLISGEMHMGTGEEAIVAGVMPHLQEGDALSADHRGSAPFLMRGVDPVLLLRELLGRQDGLCGGHGGHMHLYSKVHLAASSGIVGASGPAAAGFALAAQVLRPGSIAVAFFGEGAMNQGMLMESINLAAVWKLPVLFVCKNDSWAITTRPGAATCGDLGSRVRGLGVPYIEVDGLDVQQVWRTAQQAIDHARQGGGPTLLHARCIHLEGHFLGYQLLRVIRNPLRELPGIAIPLTRSFLRPGGAPMSERMAGLQMVLTTILETLRDARQDVRNDPLQRARIALQADPARLEALDRQIEAEVSAIVAASLQETDI